MAPKRARIDPKVHAEWIGGLVTKAIYCSEVRLPDGGPLRKNACKIGVADPQHSPAGGRDWQLTDDSDDRNKYTYGRIMQLPSSFVSGRAMSGRINCNCVQFTHPLPKLVKDLLQDYQAQTGFLEYSLNTFIVRHSRPEVSLKAVHTKSACFHAMRSIHRPKDVQILCMS